MKIKWLGHATFVITTQNGKVILVDPYESGCYGDALRYPRITAEADVVTVSHQHTDHNNSKMLSGKPQVINKDGEHEVSGMKIKGIPTYHDTSQGKERGENTVFVYDVDDLKLVHLGDLGHMLTKEQLDKIGKVDILMIPVGGCFTIDAQQASEIARTLDARIVIPMHYKTDLVDFPIASVDDFISGKDNVKSWNTSEVSVTRDQLPPQPEIWVFPYTK